jgi:hypothetical protein
MASQSVTLHRAARKLACPTCHAKAGEVCRRVKDELGANGRVVSSAGSRMADHHPARNEAAGGRPASNGRVGAGRPPTGRLYGQPATAAAPALRSWLLEPEANAATARRNREVHLHADETADIKITLSGRAFDTIVADVAPVGDLVESGGILLGEWSRPGVLLIADAGRHGENAKRTPTTFGADHHHDILLEQEHAWTGRKSAGHWHSHPFGGNDKPSENDLQSWAARLEIQSDYWPPLPFVGLIVTAPRLPGSKASGDWKHPTLSAWVTELASQTGTPWYRCKRATVEVTR